MVEFIDIGGPTMIRASAKNYRDVVVVCDPNDYMPILEELKTSGVISQATRMKLAAKVFTTMAAYDASVARYFSLSENILDESGKRIPLAPVEAIVLERKQELRYGENPHQHAGLYRQVTVGQGGSPEPWQILQGKELSYNNLLDLHGALDLFLELMVGRGKKHPAVIIKHSNPCGAALSDSPLQAFIDARECDPVSAFGGIVVLSGRVDAELAREVTAGFVEVVAVSDLSPEASEIFSKKKNVRLIKCDFKELVQLRSRGAVSVRNAFGDYLLQTVDGELNFPDIDKVVTVAKPDDAMLADLEFAWRVGKHVKSNAIVIVKDGKAIGVGAGQMSRLDSAKIAVQRAETHGHSVSGAVAASDAFLPFPDTLEILHEAGVKALVQPGGSIKDQDVIAAADLMKVVMIFTGERHFRH
jgi:phosphoribosylaminoimidazolecarboxamide formyltransferase/IMP cyclohydrolase